MLRQIFDGLGLEGSGLGLKGPGLIDIPAVKYLKLGPQKTGIVE